MCSSSLAACTGVNLLCPDCSSLLAPVFHGFNHIRRSKFIPSVVSVKPNLTHGLQAEPELLELLPKHLPEQQQRSQVMESGMVWVGRDLKDDPIPWAGISTISGSSSLTPPVRQPQLLLEFWKVSTMAGVAGGAVRSLPPQSMLGFPGHSLLGTRAQGRVCVSSLLTCVG